MLIKNKKAQFNYNLLEKYEAGISLTGAEVKSLRTGGADLSQSYAKIINNEAYLINANIPGKVEKNYNPTRSRKLLLHKRQIISIQSKIKAKKLTLVPVRVYNRGRRIKLELALAKAKRKFEKKEAIKKKDIDRELQEALKSKIRNPKL